MTDFLVPGIGRVTIRRGETRARAEKRARIDHGRKSLRLAVTVPGLGMVRARPDETFRDALKRKRKAHAVRSQLGKARKAAIAAGEPVVGALLRPDGETVLFTGGGAAQELISNRHEFGGLIAKGIRDLPGPLTLEISGVIQIAPLFTTSRLFRITVTIDDPSSADSSVLDAAIRAALGSESPNLIVIEAVEVV